VPSHIYKPKNKTGKGQPPPTHVRMPWQPPPLGYMWSYRRTGVDGDGNLIKIKDWKGNITPPFKWTLVS